MGVRSAAGGGGGVVIITNQVGILNLHYTVTFVTMRLCFCEAKMAHSSRYTGQLTQYFQLLNWLYILNKY